MADYPYTVTNPSGEIVLQAAESCRYPRLVELPCWRRATSSASSKENHENRNAKGDAQMKPLKTGDPCPCCGMPIKSTNPEMLRLLTDIRDFGFSLRDAERVAALLKKEQEAADGTM